MRIDLVYATEAFAQSLRSAYVDREARKGKGPSDHAPIVVDVEPLGTAAPAAAATVDDATPPLPAAALGREGADA